MAYQLEEVDIVQGSSFGQSSRGFKDVTRLRVSGIPAPAPSGFRYDVLGFIGGKGYYYGAPHPRAPSCYIVDINGEPFARGKTAMYVNVEYGPAEGSSAATVNKVTVQGSCGIRNFKTDKDGKLYRVFYKDPADPNAVQESDVVTLSAIAPGTIITFEWRSQTPPLALNRLYRAKINSTPWMGFAPRTVLCRTFDAVASQALAFWEYAASFEWSPYPGGWRQLAIFRDSNNGKVPPGINPGTFDNQVPDAGWEYFTPYELVDFNQIGLPNIG